MERNEGPQDTGLTGNEQLGGTATPSSRTGRTRRRVGRRLPNAFAAAIPSVVLVAAVAFGATSLGPMVLTGAAAPTCQDEQGNIIPCPTDEPTATPTATPTPTPTPTATPTHKPDPTPSGRKDPGPTDKPDPTHRPKPHPEALGLDLRNVDGGVLVDWTMCHARGFDAYKVVRSTDSTVSWPLGPNDTLVGVVRLRGRTFLVDGDAPSNVPLWYRVFCVRRTGDGFAVLGSTRARTITRHAWQPPKPSTIGLDAQLTDAGVALDWAACPSDAFRWYKVVRSHGDNPSYVPPTEGSQLIGIIENRSTTSFTDVHVESGQTWFYRIQAVGYWHDRRVVLCQSAAVEVTIP